ncbi:MAG: phosphoribosylamine--glycine ligase [SAR324 cluster bacterium]|nr:phosphoribosylamine--glycine ligase [SAR324 cluster bacterium]
MKVLIIGGGGREHALAWKLSGSPRVTDLYASPGSDAIAALAQCVNLTDHQAVADFAEKEGIDLTVVGPEAPLVDGLADLLSARGLRAFGPSRAAAALEGSKAFAKNFMQRHNIPTAPHATFDDPEAACAYLEKQEGPYVIKADGLAAGKGVVIRLEREEARQAIHSMMVDKAFGTAGERVVIEGFLRGEEASYFVISDGANYVALPSVQDHKPIGELDRGPNTGGMGAYCPAPVVTPETERKVLEQIVEPTLRGMAADGHPYSGVLYVGLMISDGDPYVVEYNCRFGDPECQPLMMMLESDLADLLDGAARGEIAQVKPRWRKGAAACIVMASGGYPGEYSKGAAIHGLGQTEEDDTARVFHAGTVRANGGWATNGGRVLGVTAWGENLSAALERGYRMVEGISWEGATYRRDIGLKGLKHDRAGRPGVNVGIVLGSASDMEIADKVTSVLERLNIGYELAVASAHRTPQRVSRFIKACQEQGAEVFIAIAGMAAALPGVVAAETVLPVIGVPVKSSAFEGMDALLSIAQMPPGVPVATVGVNGGANAALLAAEILALKYPDLQAGLKEYRLDQENQIEEAHRAAGLSKLI